MNYRSPEKPIQRVKFPVRIIALLFLLLTVRMALPDTVTVVTQYGLVKGLRNSGMTAFLSIPYAKPPVGSLRWRAPAAPAAWTSAIDAMNFPPECPQMQFTQGSDTGIYKGSEDCLYLCVWVPATAVDLPVMVFIHGGGNQQGSVTMMHDGAYMYDGRYLSQHENIIVVSLQYRLGSLGFLAHPGLTAEDSHGSSGDYGLLDQIFALQWVKRNIRAFGGDSTRVAIFGQSAGGMDIDNLLVSPLAGGLFSGAIPESGAPVAFPRSQAESSGVSFLRDSLRCQGVTDAEQIASARALSAETLVANSTDVTAGGTIQTAWGPVVDGYVIPDAPLNLLQSGNFNRVPIMVGSTADEVSLMVPSIVTPALVELKLRGAVPASMVDQGLALYPPGTTNAQARQAYIAMLTDAQFTVNARKVAAAAASNGGSVYRYFFSHTMSGIQGLLGAYHGIELFYIFRTIQNTQSYALSGKMTLNDTLVMDLISAYWAQFARTGNPNIAGRPAWPLSSTPLDPYLEIKPVPAAANGLRTAECDFWDSVAAYRRVAATKECLLPQTLSLASQVRCMPAGGLSVELSMAHTINRISVMDIRGRELGRVFPKRNSSLYRWNVPRGVYMVRLFGTEGSRAVLTACVAR